MLCRYVPVMLYGCNSDFKRASYYTLSLFYIFMSLAIRDLIIRPQIIVVVKHGVTIKRVNFGLYFPASNSTPMVYVFNTTL